MSETPKELTPLERAVAGEMLSLASWRFSKHGCNDYDLPNTPEHKSLALAAAEWAGDKDPEVRVHGDKLGTMDWLLMDYLAARLKGEC